MKPLNMDNKSVLLRHLLALWRSGAALQIHPGRASDEEINDFILSLHNVCLRLNITVKIQIVK